MPAGSSTRREGATHPIGTGGLHLQLKWVAERVKPLDSQPRQTEMRSTTLRVTARLRPS